MPEAYKRVLGPEHPSTLVSIKYLASTLLFLGRFETTLQMMAECAALSDQHLEPGHPDTLFSKAFLGKWHHRLNRRRFLYFDSSGRAEFTF